MDLNLSGKVAIVTGGGGYGRTFCLAFSNEGVRAFVADIDSKAARDVGQEIKGTGNVEDLTLLGGKMCQIWLRGL